jgi:hypothetical protein
MVRIYATITLATFIGTHALDPQTECWPTGVPLILENTSMQIIQQPDNITVLYSETYEVRQVRMDQPHPAQVIPSWNGVGHYEGDTLVIDTVGVKVGSFPAPGLYSMVDLFGTPHTSALHVVERYRLLDHETAKAIEEPERKVACRWPGRTRELNLSLWRRTP